MHMMSGDCELAVPKENAIKSVEKLKKENDETQAEVNQLQNVKLFYQRQKGYLLTRHSQCKCFIESRQLRINEARQKTSGEVTKKFDQLFPLAEDIYYKQLLLLELREQQLLAQIQQESNEVLQVIKAIDLKLAERSDKTRQYSDNPLIAWHHYMTCYVDENARLLKQRKKASCLNKNAVFYNVKLKTSEELCFSTRHRGICVFISIQALRKSTDLSTFILTSDLPLQDLQYNGEVYLKRRRNPVDFVMDVVWKEVEELLPLM